MTYTLGIVPDDLTVNLHADAPFASTLANDDGDWPAGTVVELRFLGNGGTVAPATWTAVLTGPSALFSADAADVNMRANNEPVELRVNEFCWASGQVAFYGRG